MIAPTSPHTFATNPFDLTGRRALVTGSTQGIGAAIAIALAEAGGHFHRLIPPSRRLGLVVTEAENRRLFSFPSHGPGAPLFPTTI